MIIAPAIKTKEGKIFASRNSHAEIIILHPKDFKNAEQGFITDKLDFVDRKEALKIAKECKQDINKLVDNDELYSEDLFLSGGINKMDIPKQVIQEEIAILERKINRILLNNKLFVHVTVIRIDDILNKPYEQIVISVKENKNGN